MDAGTPRKHLRLRVIAMCVGIGAAVNVMIAWTLAARLDPDQIVAQQVRIGDDPEFSHAALNRLRVFLGHQASDDEVIVCDELLRGAERRIAFVDPYWRATTRFASDVRVDASQPLILRSRVRAGWPVRSLESMASRAATLESAPRPVLDRRWELAVHLSGDIDQRSLPLKPLWPGFAINTLAYAALVWLVLFAPFALRRALRRRRGQCERCAYPRGASDVCTECGATLEHTSRTSTA